jgi:hypothetical protein
MNPEELVQIAKNHVDKNNVKAHHLSLISMMHNAVQNGFKLYRSHDTIFAYLPQHKNVHFGIVDGGNAKDFLSASGDFIFKLRNHGFKTVSLYTDKPDYAKRVMTRCGIKNIYHETHVKKVDPYLMRGTL